MHPVSLKSLPFYLLEQLSAQKWHLLELEPDGTPFWL